MELSHKIRSPVRLIVSVIACNLVGASGTVFTVTGAGSWYSGLVKPWFTPPGWLFGPAWTILFTLMGVALYCVWMEWGKSPLVPFALLAFAVQFVFNVLWSYLFFGLQSPYAGLVGILVLLVAIIITLLLFYRVRPLAGVLLVPYLAWVTFATFLNYSIYALQPGGM